MKRLRFFLRAFGRRLLRCPPLLRTAYVEELPDAVSGGQLFVISEDGYAWCAAMACPCGCGETLQMSLHLEGPPRWTFEEHNDGTPTSLRIQYKLSLFVFEEHNDGTPTLHPSVWRQIGCRSHFFLRKGVVIWCRAV